MSVLYGNNQANTIVGNNTGSLNSIFGGKGSDVLQLTLTAAQQNTILVNNLHGEAGRDVLITNAKFNGALPNSTELPNLGEVANGLTTNFLSGGRGHDIIENSSIDPNGLSVYVSDSRLFDPKTFAMKTTLKGSDAFLEGGHDVMHGSTAPGSVDILELRGAGWEIRLDNGAVINAANMNTYFTVDPLHANQMNMTLPPGVTSGMAMVKMINADACAQNTLHTISFDNMEKIVLFDGKLGGSNTDYGLANSTAAISALNTSNAAYSKISDSTGDVMFGKNVNLSFSGSSNDDVMYAGSGNKTLDGNGGNDVLFAGDGNQVLMGGKGDDTFVFRDVDVKTGDHINHTYQVWGGDASTVSANNNIFGCGNDDKPSLMGTNVGGKDWLDLSALKSDHITITYSNGVSLTGGATVIADSINHAAVMDLTGNQKAGTITVGDTTIQYHGIDRIII